jgi:hypothetical protein
VKRIGVRGKPKRGRDRAAGSAVWAADLTKRTTPAPEANDSTGPSPALTRPLHTPKR